MQKQSWPRCWEGEAVQKKEGQLFPEPSKKQTVLSTHEKTLEKALFPLHSTPLPAGLEEESPMKKLRPSDDSSKKAKINMVKVGGEDLYRVDGR